MKKPFYLIMFLFLPVFFACAPGSKDKPVNQSDSTMIGRIIDVSKQTRPFPDLVAYRNTSLQKAPAPVIGMVAADAFGIAGVTRCWLNLDEMWDYRSRKYDFNFRIGVDKYKGVETKHRESWNWELESPVNYYDYLKAFNDNSEELMLTIRRYEKDIIDKKLPVTMKDWKMIFKGGLKHYKEKFKKIRYIEVCNEYELKGFAAATDEQYYEFYKLAYQAVNEINKELGLSGKDALLVGGPVSTNLFMKRIETFLNNYNNDKSPDKRIDFISWHEYHQKMSATVNREKEIKALLTKYGLSEKLPLFISEHDPYHFSEDKLEYHMLNSASLPKTLYFSSISSPSIMIIPWVLYHNSKIQTKFMWFEGPNNPDTKAEEIIMLPTGASMKFLTMHTGKEIRVENSVEANDLVIASAGDKKLIVQVINYDTLRKVNITLTKLDNVFPGEKGSYRAVKYIVDSKYSNPLTNPSYPGGPERAGEENLKSRKGVIQLLYEGLKKNGIVLWEITPAY